MSRVGGIVRRIVAVVGLGLAAAFAAALPAAALPASGGIPRAGVDDFTFASVDVHYELSRGDDGVGVATVAETFVAVFPPAQNRGMVRGIPTEYLGVPTHRR